MDMKPLSTKASRPRAAVGTFFAAFLGGALLATAQPESDKGKEPPSPPREGAQRGPRQQFSPGAPGQFGPGGFSPLYARLANVLTEEQRASLRQAMEAQREKVRGLEEKLRDARKEIFEAGLKEKFDEEAVREKALAMAKLDAEMTVLRAKAFSKVHPPLSPEQVEKLKNAPAFGSGEIRGESPRRRPDRQRDEHGLPPKQ